MGASAGSAQRRDQPIDGGEAIVVHVNQVEERLDGRGAGRVQEPQGLELVGESLDQHRLGAPAFDAAKCVAHVAMLLPARRAQVLEHMRGNQPPKAGQELPGCELPVTVGVQDVEEPVRLRGRQTHRLQDRLEAGLRDRVERMLAVKDVISKCLIQCLPDGLQPLAQLETEVLDGQCRLDHGQGAQQLRDGDVPAVIHIDLSENLLGLGSRQRENIDALLHEVAACHVVAMVGVQVEISLSPVPFVPPRQALPQVL
mmetsp:Transcript_68017/g.196971  ORF Transcript_68017/g.196971 Transcript_68017/m.196971 type:complete len:256 (+) Transcript_68017:898-1665(+)